MRLLDDRLQDMLGREYLRVSQDRTGTGRSPDQQHEVNRQRFEEMRLRLHPQPYRDDDRSASRFKTKPREGFDQLMADLETGNFDADILVIWESSRASRDMEEWPRLINLCERNGVYIYVTKDDQLYDPSKARDRRSLQDDAVDAEYESAKTSDRIRRDTLARAKEGGVHGKKIYGYLRIYDPKTGRRTGIEPHPEQAPIVQEAAQRVLAGETSYAIAKDFNAREIPPRRMSYRKHNAGRGWTVTAIRQMLVMPAYAGLRQHLSNEEKRAAKAAKREAVPALYPAEWPALISREDWEQLQSIFATRVRTNDITAKHLLTGIATCGVCGGIMRMGKQNAGKKNPETGERKTYRTYQCQGTPGQGGFHVSIRQTHLDYAITEAIIAYLERPDVLAVLGQDDQGVDEERAALLKEIDDHRKYLEEFRAMAAAKHRPELIFDQEERIQPLIKKAEAKLRRMTKIDPLVLELADADDVRDHWERLDLEQQRRVIRALVVPVVDRIKPENRGKRGIDLSRLAHSAWR